MAVDASPDLICITGDFITHRTGFDPRWYVKALSRLSAKAPTFAVMGNHDGGLWAARAGHFETTAEVGRIVVNAGIRLLENRCEQIQCNGADLQLVGVGDLWAGNAEPAQAFERASPALPTILLSHNPDSKAVVAHHPWDLMLSGHTHGGQVVVPVVGLNPAPVWDREYIAGLNRWNDRWIHTSRGVGSIRGIRFNCRPEVTLLHLRPRA
jgi:predicted MPP superfamily phosphohydrolase